ncbi:hypothetical protein [Arenimonas composti]|uniref:Uncharacterized protein n=1 Tax=Arenimonas composti TR7-09 = DSM 18010 TaxID=1121013 RepID=A0A091BBQ7_9GAMM|nr:hypothetical protein [Arenimonas composti]KFN48269.1 hypothetical protein P873_01550 [Arenimonas composti TR7-09 = DSM 18010]
MVARRAALLVLTLALLASWFGWRYDGFAPVRDAWRPLPATPVTAPAGEGNAAAAAPVPSRLVDQQVALLAIRAAERTRDAEARCLAMPDPPGTAWPAATVAARCALLRKAAMPLPVMRELLSRGRAARLHQVHAELLVQHFEDPGRREQIFSAFRQFDGSREAGAIATAWLRAAPRDPYALTAAGWQRLAGLAGADPAADATRRAVGEAQDQFERALAAEPRLVPACVGAARGARLLADWPRHDALIGRCREIDPEGFHVLAEVAEAARQRPDGAATLQALAAFAAEAGSRRPVLASLANLPASAAAAAAGEGDVVAAWDRALHDAPPPVEVLVAAATRLTYEDPLQALLLRSQALRFDPCGWACHRRERLELLVNAGQLPWAETEMTALLAAAPDDWALLGRLEAVRRVIGPATAMADGDTGSGATSPWFDQVEACLQAISAGNRADAAAPACSAELVEARPDDPYAWYARLRWLERSGRPGAHLALRRLMETVDRGKPEQRALLDRTLAEHVPAPRTTGGWVAAGGR